MSNKLNYFQHLFLFFFNKVKEQILYNFSRIFLGTSKNDFQFERHHLRLDFGKAENQKLSEDLDS